MVAPREPTYTQLRRAAAEAETRPPKTMQHNLCDRGLQMTLDGEEQAKEEQEACQASSQGQATNSPDEPEEK